MSDAAGIVRAFFEDDEYSPSLDVDGGGGGVCLLRHILQPSGGDSSVQSKLQKSCAVFFELAGAAGGEEGALML